MRLFLAVEVPEEQKRSIEKVVQPLRLKLAGARWVPQDAWHVTVKFLGEVADERLEEVAATAAAVCGQARPTASRLREMGAFPTTARPRVLWVGLDDPQGSVAAVAGALEQGFAARGFRQESRAWRPHLTLARFRDPAGVTGLARDLEAAGCPDPSPFSVREVALFRSRLKRTGAEYEALRRFPLGGGGIITPL